MTTIIGIIENILGYDIGIMEKTLETTGIIWASPETPMWKFLYKTTTAGLKDLPGKVAMVLAKGTLDFTKEVS